MQYTVNTKQTRRQRNSTWKFHSAAVYDDMANEMRRAEPTRNHQRVSRPVLL
jgi:hypothetical protein